MINKSEKRISSLVQKGETIFRKQWKINDWKNDIESKEKIQFYWQLIEFERHFKKQKTKYIHSAIMNKIISRR